MSSPIEPRADVRALTDRPFAEVLIVGGGINGAGIFRDLAMQGVDVALVERGDFCGGASAASSHMIHGGIRYLENGEFRLVREALLERNDLLRTAPHFVEPLRTVIPLTSTFAGLGSAVRRFLTHRPSIGSRGAVLVKTGLVLYDAFARRTSPMPGHRLRRRSQASAAGMFSPEVSYLAEYHDAAIREPERLAVDIVVETARRGSHARAANYLAVIGSSAAGAVLKDEVTGEEFTFRASVVINVTGPWVDETNRLLGRETALMGGTRGSHVVLRNPELLAATGGDEIFFEHEDGRIVLIHPMKGLVMVGTTDLPHDIRVPAQCTDDEVAYFLSLIRHVFPTVSVDASQIVFAFSGVRPLPRADGLRPGFVSRDYRMEQHGSAGDAVLSVVGGKWTTFRALAESVTDRTLGLLSRERTSSTLGVPIGGGSGFPMTEEDRCRWLQRRSEAIDPERSAGLLNRYGTRADELIARLRDDPEVPLASLPAWTGAELRWIVETEHVVHLADLVLRRTDVAFTGAAGESALREMAEQVSETLGWSARQMDAEVSDVVRTIREAMPPIARSADVVAMGPSEAR